MEKQRKIKILTVVAMVVVILGLTVAFAVLSQTLTINGSANIGSSSWNIYFSDLEGPSLTGSAEENGSAQVTTTTISGLNMSVTKPGDSVTYSFDIVNDGTIDAVLDTDLNQTLFYQGYINCIFSSENECTDKYDFNDDGIVNVSDYNIMISDLDYVIYDTETNKMLAKGDVIEAKTTKHCKLVFEIRSNSSYITTKALTSSDTITLTFVQE